jgi:hypothetical protein
MEGDSTEIRVTAWAVIEKGAAVLGTLGLALYGVVRVAYDAFYGRLGASAEEVGLNYIAIVTRAALSLLGLSVTAILLGAITALGVWPGLRKVMRKKFFADNSSSEVESAPEVALSGAETHGSTELEEGSPTDSKRSKPLTAESNPTLSPVVLIHILAVTLAIYLTLIAFLDVGIIANTLDLLPRGFWRGVMLGVVAPIFVATMVTLLFRKWHRRMPTWSLLTWAVALVLVGLLPALALSSLIGEHAARKVEQGGELQHQSWLPWLPGPGAFAFNATWVTVSWVDGNGPSNLSGGATFIYLGTADGRAVLYCPKQGVTRLPAGNLVVMPPANGNRKCG